MVHAESIHVKPSNGEAYIKAVKCSVLHTAESGDVNSARKLMPLVAGEPLI